MKLFSSDSGNAKFNRIILYIIAGIVAILLIGTAIALVRHKTVPGVAYRKADPSPQKVINMSAKKDGKVAAYTALGEIRTITKASDSSSSGVILVVSPWFAYSDGDSALFEELSQKDRQLKSIITTYLSTYTVKELHTFGEKKVKDDLLSRINEQLVLGKISAVYFDKYVYFE